MSRAKSTSASCPWNGLVEVDEPTLENDLHQCDAGVAGVDVIAGQTLEQNAAEAPEIRAELGWVAHHLLGAHVAG